MTHEKHAIETQTTALANQGKGYQDEEYQEPTRELAVFNGNPSQVMEQMTSIVKHVAKQIDNSNFIANIKGKNYPKVEWWTTVGASLGLFPVVVWSKRLNREDEVAYESRVEVLRQGKLITAGEAICSSAERSWKGRDEYAIKSMSITRATGKAYRIGLSMIAVMSGLEGTPAEEIPVEGFPDAPQQPRTRSNHEKRTGATPDRDNASQEDKPWLNRSPRGSTRITEEWQEVEDNLTSGAWTMSDVLDRYKLSKANRAELDRMAVGAKKTQPQVEGFPADDPDDGDGELPF